MVPRNCTRHRRAFTLIELLVVISIITLLMSIIMPSLGKSKIITERVICGTRLKGITTAMSTYLAEFQDTFPVNGIMLPKRDIPDMYKTNESFTKFSEPNPEKWRLEFGALWRNMGGTRVDPSQSLPLPLATQSVRKAYICPSDLRNGLLRTYTGSDTTSQVQPLLLSADNPPHVVAGPGQPGYWSYSVNSVLNSMGRFRNKWGSDVSQLPWSDPLRVSRVRAPSSFICFMEEDDASLFNDEVVDAPAYSQGDMLTKRHAGFGNVGYLDGHVDAKSASIFNHVPSAIDGQYVEHTTPMQSEITREFFPDAGAFALK